MNCKIKALLVLFKIWSDQIRQCIAILGKFYIQSDRSNAAILRKFFFILYLQNQLRRHTTPISRPHCSSCSLLGTQAADEVKLSNRIIRYICKRISISIFTILRYWKFSMQSSKKLKSLAILLRVKNHNYLQFFYPANPAFWMYVYM